MKLTAQVLSDDEKQQIHEQSLRILFEVGVRFHGDKAPALLQLNGARIDPESGIAHIPGEMIEHALASAPREFTLGARNPKFNYPLPSSVTRYAMDGTGAFMVDFATNERRYGEGRDIVDALRIFQEADMGVMAWPPVCASEAPAGSRPLHEFFAMAEQILGGPIPDVVTLQRRLKPFEPPRAGGGVAVADSPPKARFVTSAEFDRYVGKANRIVIKHRLGQVVAVLEIVSPGNKSSTHALRSFVRKTEELLRQGINLLVVDLFPPPMPRPAEVRADPGGVRRNGMPRGSAMPFCPRRPPPPATPRMPRTRPPARFRSDPTRPQRDPARLHVEGDGERVVGMEPFLLQLAEDQLCRPRG